ncbi:LOW QUALITY PROTEIN: hypothetical protein MXB_1102 [Myxobolus squamalis]|nr:LOW QUALITY PROTEIN: hypothetical protein MXB_1102 [Myxobolus squamalis]
MQCELNTSHFFKLPLNVIPREYDLKLAPCISEKIFYGTVVISIDVEIPSKEIFIHSCDHSFSEVKLIQDLQGKLIIFLHLENICVQIEYKKIDEANRQLIQPADARRAFPCFDEPCFKATFKIRIIYETHKTVLSNMDLETLNLVGDELAEYSFCVTPKMSTYLVAVVIGDFDRISSSTKSGTRVSIFMPVDKVRTGIHALTATQKIVEFYNEYFKIPYPIPKLDMVALPDISFGAMENWGLVTFREDLLLVDSKHSSMYTIQSVYLVVAHEIAHQWFGNLVTMKWWNDLWLNEGFANWIEYLAVNSCYPELNIWRLFTVSNHCRALELDSLVNSHAIEAEITILSELDQIFDDITYCKGASLINMMYNYIGDEAFSCGLKDYFQLHMYKNVTTGSFKSSADLWQSLRMRSSKPIELLMKSFTEQTGFPLVSVSHKKVTLSQKRYFLDGSTNDQLWVIPITFFINLNALTLPNTVLLEKSEEVIQLELHHDLDFIHLNPSRTGFYRVLYSDELLERLLENVVKLNVAERLGVISDCFAFCRSGHFSTEKYLQILLRFRDAGELNEEVWDYIVSTLHRIHSLLYYSANSTDIPRFWLFCNSLLTPILQSFEISPNPDSISDGEIRLIGTIWSLLIITDDENVGSILRSWVSPYMAGELDVEPSFRRFMFMASFKSYELFDKLIDHFITAKMTEEKINVLIGVSGSTDPNTIRDIYHFSMNENVKPQDGRFIFSVLGENSLARSIGWEFIKTNFTQIHAHFKVKSIVSRIIKDTILRFCDLKIYDEIVQFIKSTPEMVCERSLRAALENIKINHHWLLRDNLKISEWLKDKFSK